MERETRWSKLQCVWLIICQKLNASHRPEMVEVGMEDGPVAMYGSVKIELKNYWHQFH